MAFGEVLKNARVQKGLTPSDVAESTHLLVQVVEDLEREDFRRVAAPIYGRGFVKLYAELLELDPEPLIREFMNLYSGARAPAIRTKKTEEEPSAVSEPTPVTRTVTGTPSTQPQRQPVAAKPAVAVRALHVQPATEAPAAEGEPSVDNPVAVADSGADEAPFEVAATESDTAAPLFVVEPEESESEDAEPDLFNPRPHLRREARATEREAPDEKPKSAVLRKPRLPIFKIGGRLEKPLESEMPNEEGHARRNARVRAFVEGFAALREGVEKKFPRRLPQKRVMVLGGAILAAFVMMAAGVRVLFKMTGNNVRQSPNLVFESLPPPPDLYVD